MGSPEQVAMHYQYSEPIFGVVTPGIIQDTLLHMAMENERYLSELCDEAGCFKDTQIVEFIFLLAEKWSLTETATYQAIEIFERFMLKLLEEFSNFTPGKKDDSRWASLKEQIEGTYVLRLVSCIQLASKLSFHYSVKRFKICLEHTIVNNNMVLKFLKSLGFFYTTKELLESELTVLKALHFQVNVPVPLAYIEILLEVLGKPKKQDTLPALQVKNGYNGYLLPTKELHEMCKCLLSLSYLLRNSIYDTLLKSSIENSSPSELQLIITMAGIQSLFILPFQFRRAKFVSVKEDFMLLAVGVIGASSFLLNHEDWNQVMEYLSGTTGISLHSITEAVYAILKHSLGSMVDSC